MTQWTGEMQMWRERAEAAEDELRRIHGPMSKRDIAAAEIYSLAIRLVALAGLESSGAIGRACQLIQSNALEEACEDDRAALMACADLIQRRALEAPSRAEDS